MDNIEKNLSLRWQVYRTHNLNRYLVAAFYERDLAEEFATEFEFVETDHDGYQVIDAITNP